jgi:hypothetical protein
LVILDETFGQTETKTVFWVILDENVWPDKDEKQLHEKWEVQVLL